MALTAKLPRSKKCRNKSCGKTFVPARQFQQACSVPCALEIAAKQREQKEARANKAERNSLREARERIKTRAEHMKEAQAAVNAYVRLRDANDPCISCDRPATWGGQWHASHFRAVGSNPGWRFNLQNIHRACSICNAWLSGNIGSYRPRLIAKIGLDRVEMLESESPPRKFDIEYLKRIKKIFRAKTRRLAKRRGDSVTHYEEAA
jgi:hypothetical protein